MTRTLPPAEVGSDLPNALDDSGGDAAGQAERVAHRHDELPHLQAGRLAEAGGGWGLAVGADHSQVRERICADHVEGDDSAVREGGLAGVGVADDVGVREQEPVVGEDHRGARTSSEVAVATASRHLQGCHPGVQLGGHRGDDLGVSVEDRGPRTGFGWVGEGFGHGCASRLHDYLNVTRRSA